MTEHKKRGHKPRNKAKKAKYDSISYLTGDIGLNINHFNQRMGTSDLENSAESSLNSVSASDAGGIGESLVEAKRYVRRYYIRPQNIFCSNKAEIIKALIDLDNANCSVYTLNNLGDEKDVSKLMNSDIIYYYDDGILYDKNRVKVMDYDLSIKKEENRKHFANVDKAPEKEFKDVYSDRMTDATELEESLLMNAFNNCNYDVIKAEYTDKNEILVVLNHNVSDIEEAAEHLISCLEAENNISILDWNTNGSNVFIFNINDIDNAFNIDFEDFNAFGERLTEAKESFCCICGEPLEDYGNNPEPFRPSYEGNCCDGCFLKFVI